MPFDSLACQDLSMTSAIEAGSATLHCSLHITITFAGIE